MDYLVLAGAVVIVAGILVILLTFLTGSGKGEVDGRRVEVKGGGVVMVGPIPIVFGSDARWAVIAMLLAIALIVLGLLFSARVL